MLIFQIQRQIVEHSTESAIDLWKILYPRERMIEKDRAKNPRCTALQTRSRADRPWSTGGMVVSPVVALHLQQMSPNWWLSTRTPWKLAMVNMQAMPEPVQSSHRRCLRCGERESACARAHAGSHYCVRHWDENQIMAKHEVCLLRFLWDNQFAILKIRKK